MGMTLPYQLDACTLTTLTHGGQLSVTDIATSIIRRIEERDSAVRAYAHFDPAQVLAAAQMLDAAPHKGPLHGVPIAIKDVINTKDMPTQHNSARYHGHQPGMDAACVDTLRQAGALLIGKTVTTEFATTNRGSVTRNPHDLACTPGGSSSGSAAAVADFQATLALGTQTGGSTIRPASFCGIYGFKPTWNAISREGLKMYSATCDTLGLYGRSADDLALLADVFALDATETALADDLAGKRIGVCLSPAWPKAERATQQAMNTAIDALKQAGAVVSDIALPAMFDGILAAHHIILRREGRSAFLNEANATPDLHDELKAIVENRQAITPSQARDAYRLADQCRAAFDDIAASYDVILTPSSMGEAPRGIETTGDAIFNSIWTLMQVPVVNVPGLYGPNCRPVGVSLMAQRYQDRKVIAYAGLLGATLQNRQSMAAE
ncbi:amidase [Agrobacterium vitis]|nr:amidase [Agrobacterium vitis]NSZ55538.1 amidase [Agrobacterium vitis]NTA34789.1 amidase [Agrobacterium vitis]